MSCPSTCPSTSLNEQSSVVTSANQLTQKAKVIGPVRKVHSFRPGTAALREIKYKRRRTDDDDLEEESSQPSSSRQGTGKMTDHKKDRKKQKKDLSETAELKRELAQRLFDEAFGCAPMIPGGGSFLVKCMTDDADDADKQGLSVRAILDRNVVYRVRFYEEHINRSEAFKAEKVELDDMPGRFQEYVTEVILDKQSFQVGWHKWVGDDEEWQSYDVDDFTDGVGAFECMQDWKLK